VTKCILSLSPEKVDHDVLGQVFHKLIPQKLRRRVAMFYTNPEAAEMLARLAIEDANAKAYRKRREAHEHAL
jgi:hypothetical protein